jgi:sugar O-acyltransferase (sialic acid O-acetyltransferase NeuD family)
MNNSVTIPLLNPNEPDALVAALHVREGQHVSAGDLLATLETTKSAADLQAEQAGFIAGLYLSVGAIARAGDILCYISDDPNWSPPEPAQPASQAGAAGKPFALTPEGLRITQPALALACQLGMDLSNLPTDRLVTENMLRALLSQPIGRLKNITEADDQDTGLVTGDKEIASIIVYGGGGHGKALIEMLHALHTYQIVGIIDDGIAAGETIMGVPVLGGDAMLSDLYAKGIRQAVNAVGGIGNIAIRIKVFQNLVKAGFRFPAVVHPAAYVENSASLAPGVQVFARAYVGSEAQLGFGAIVNTGAIVSHDCVLENFANISPGALLAGEVRIGAACLVGMGATINLRVRVGDEARIGNGATVKEDVPTKGIVRAGTIWPQ